MQSDAFKIYVDRLSDGKVEQFEESFPPDFLEQKGEELSYEREVRVKGDAYVANGELILHLDVETFLQIPCKICNSSVELPVSLKGIYIVEPLTAIRSGIYLFKDRLREAILLEAPSFVECSDGHCPERSEKAKYLSKEGPDDGERGRGGEGCDPKGCDHEGYRPFAGLDL